MPTARPAHHRARRRALAIAFALVASSLAALGNVEPAQAAGNPGGFYDGSIAYSSITNCVSIIQGAPYSEYGAGAYSGAYADPDEVPAVPGASQTFYMHVVVYGLGNSCSGQRFVPAVDLPAGVSFNTSVPILCFGSTGQLTGPTDCPQWGNVVTSSYGGDMMYLSSDTANARTWPLPTGKSWEFRFPIVSSGTQSGAAMHSYVKMFDGNSSPILDAKSSLWVFGAAASPTILYSSPSTVAGLTLPGSATAPKFGFYSTANFFAGGQGGTGAFEIGTTPGSYPQKAAFSIPSGSNNWLLYTDWDEPTITAPVPGTTYYWRASFDPAGAAGPIYGAEQRFTVPSSLVCNGQKVTVSIGLGQQPTAGSDVIMGTTRSEAIAGLGGNDVICGGDGNDTLTGGAGDDTLLGGSGTDTAGYADAPSKVTVNLGTSAPQNTVGAGTDTLSSLENATGSSYDDTLTGSTGANALNAGLGNDTVNGGDGNDSLKGGTGNDKLTGGNGTDTASYAGATAAVTVNLSTTTAQNTLGAGSDTIATVENLTGTGLNDTLIGTSGANTIDGSSGNDVVKGSTGNDTLKGGSGTDTVTYSASPSAVTVNLATTTAQNTGGGGTDTLSLFENITGSSLNDKLTGTSGNNTFNGGSGTDTCNGGAGTDTAVSCEVRTGIP